AREATAPVTGFQAREVAPLTAAQSLPPTNMLTSFTMAVSFVDRNARRHRTPGVVRRHSARL
ncbi:hypothetical protein BZM27_19855, partial [Paraburkholderia steynii]